MSVAMSGTAEDTSATPYSIQTQQLLIPRLAACVYRKLKLGRSGGEVRQGRRVI